jgi:hypothetical protein
MGGGFALDMAKPSLRTCLCPTKQRYMLIHRTCFGFSSLPLAFHPNRGFTKMTPQKSWCHSTLTRLLHGQTVPVGKSLPLGRIPMMDDLVVALGALPTASSVLQGALPPWAGDRGGGACAVPSPPAAARRRGFASRHRRRRRRSPSTGAAKLPADKPIADLPSVRRPTERGCKRLRTAEDAPLTRGRTIIDTPVRACAVRCGRAAGCFRCDERRRRQAQAHIGQQQQCARGGWSEDRASPGSGSRFGCLVAASIPVIPGTYVRINSSSCPETNDAIYAHESRTC